MTSLWILNHYAITPDMPGGARHYELAKRLVQKGYSVTILASSFNHMLRQETRLKAGEPFGMEEVDGVKFVWLKTRPYQRNDWRRALNIAQYTLRAYSQGRRLPKSNAGISCPDVIIGSSVHPFAVLIAHRLARRFKVPLITEIRDLWPQTLVDFGRYKSRHPLMMALRQLESYLYKRSELIITLLSAASGYIQSRGVPPEKIVWVPNGVDTNLYSMQGKPHVPNNRFDVRYVGSHGTANNLDLLLEAAALLRKAGRDAIRFTFVGDGPERPRLIERTVSLGLTNVDFIGAVPRHQVPNALSEGSVLAITPPAADIYQFGLSPNKLYEYMAAGKPVLQACNPPNNLVKLSGCGITTKAGDAQELADAILRLSRMSPAEREAMGLRGRDYVRQHHDWAILADRLHQCIQSLTSKKAPELAARP
ncbi:MAG: glycosyltransferase family 4 protein [Chloroflexi bacterium]|nr:glycosyltransferase family 4 protein [Chloroflexota bacterium]